MIQVIHRALDIIEYISKDKNHEHTLSEIANHFGLNHATCANIIKTLVTRNFIEQMGKKRGYKLGPQIFSVTGCFIHHQDVIDAARVPMKKLTRELNEGSILSIIRDDIRELIYEEKSKNELQVNMYPEKPVYSTSTGRMILAYHSEAELEHFVKRFGLPKADVWPEVEDFEDLKLELNRMRKKEICLQESKAHIIGIAVPIFRGEKLVAALGTYMPIMRYTGDKKEVIINKLISTGHEINRAIEETARDNTLIPK